MFRKFALALGLLGAVMVFTGCANHNKTSGDTMLDVSKVEKYITPGQTTLKETRELLGTPTISGKTLDGKDFVGFSFVGSRGYGEGIAKGVGEILTLGIYSDNESYYTQKNLYFVLDDNKVVQDFKYNGYTYILHSGTIFRWSLAQRELTEAELRSSTKYSKDYIINEWKKFIVENQPEIAQKAAAKEKTTIDKLDYDDVEYEGLGFPAYLQFGAHKAFGDYTNEELNSFSGKQSYDGSKKALLGL